MEKKRNTEVEMRKYERNVTVYAVTSVNDYAMKMICDTMYTDTLMEYLMTVFNGEDMNWTLDDGDDEPGSDYVQYICELPGNGYLMATAQK